MKENRISPPQWAIRFLEWFCPPELLEGILGDLLEAFDQDSISTGPKKARRNFTLQVFRLFHPSILFRNHLNYSIMNTAIIRNHLLVAWRQMRKHRSFSMINILGLSLAIAFLFLTVLFIQQETSYDQFHTKKDNIYRLYHTTVNKETGQRGSSSAVTSVPLGEVLAEEVPVIERYSRLASSSGIIRKGEMLSRETISFSDADLLSIFDFPMLAGDRNSALEAPNSIILSAELAKKYFGSKDPLQETLELSLNDSLIQVVVTGVIDPLKESSSIQLDCILPLEQYGAIIPPKMFTSFNFGVVENYIEIKDQADVEELPTILTTAIAKSTTTSEDHLEIGIQPLKKIHFDHRILGNTPFTNPQKLYILLAIALLILVVALINFITLSSSQAMGRLSEMGLRQALGARSRQIQRQLMVESLLITSAASVLALLIANGLCSSFGQLVDANLQFRLGWLQASGVLFLILILSMISGFGQGLLLLRHQASQSLKGQFSGPFKRQWFNEGLLVFQFALSIMLILGAFHIQQQLKYIQEKDLGFEEERLLEMPLGDSPDQVSMRQKVERLKEELLRNRQILSITSGMNNIADPWTELFFKQEDGDEVSLYFNQVDLDYLETMGIRLVEGKSFPPQMKNGILVNEALVKYFGWTDPLTKQIPGINFSEPHEIIGVVEDFHFSSLHQKVEPLILAIDPSAISSGITGLSTYVWPPNLYQLFIRIGPGEIAPVLQFLEDEWQSISPDTPFEFEFVDQSLAAKYTEEKRWGKIISLSSWFGILIAWLGLFALMQVTIRRRSKEIGIRKVLGASSLNLIGLLSSRYLRLLTFSALVACPAAWYLLNRWLSSFNYRIELTPLLFGIIGIGVIFITWVIFSWQSYLVSRVNPISAIQVE